jgi:signal transduction histidine kinase
VQARLTIAATALVAAGLVAGALVLASVLRHTLFTTLDDSARQRARDVATLIDTGNLPDSIPAAGGTVLVQVVDQRGRVRAATPGGDALVPLLRGAALTAVQRGLTRELPGSRIGVSDRLRVVGTLAGPAGDRQTVLVAVSSDEAQRSLRVVGLVLLVGVPVLVASFAVVCWFLVGAALRPVEELRRGADDITEAGTGARLPVPPTRDQVHRLAVTLNEMLDRLAAGGARQRAFVADAAHELRSPLASMRTQIEVTQAHPRLDWAKTGPGVLADIERLTRLVDDLLLLARLDDDRPGRSSRPGGPVDLRDLAQAAADRPRGQSTVRVGDEVAGGSPLLVDVDRDAVLRILDNLLGNAVRYARTATTVDVRRAGSWAELTVTDDGPGIPAGERERVFERFARVDASRNAASGGSGLGLAIVRQLAESQGGTVRLEDAGPGLRAVVRLPGADRQAAPPAVVGARPHGH